MSNDDITNDDLYGDLETTKLATDKDSKSRVSERLSQEFQSRPFILGEKNVDYFDADYVNQLQKQIDDLKNENETLKRNIGTMYRTAKVELARRETELNSWRSDKTRHHS